MKEHKRYPFDRDYLRCHNVENVMRLSVNSVKADRCWYDEKKCKLRWLGIHESAITNWNKNGDRRLLVSKHIIQPGDNAKVEKCVLIT